MKVVLKVKGMMCGGCVSRVKKALEREGATDVKVELPDVCEFDEAGQGADKFVEAIEDAGYDVER